jgi:hypothetical protein
LTSLIRLQHPICALVVGVAYLLSFICLAASLILSLINMSDGGSTSPSSDEATESDDDPQFGAEASESEEDDELAESDVEEGDQGSDDSESGGGAHWRQRGLVATLQGAIKSLQRTPPTFGIGLKFLRVGRGEASPNYDEDRRLSQRLFARFVSALQRHDGIRSITLANTSFDELCREGIFDKDDLDRLFGSVLPNHPTMRSIRLDECDVPSRYVQMLAGGLRGLAGRRPEPPWELNFRETPLDLSAIQAIAVALRRSAIGKLTLHDTGMTSQKCRIITGAAAECDGLTWLKVVDHRGARPWAVDGEAFAPGSISKLFLDECLWFGGSTWNDGGAAELFRQLRTNERQERVSLVSLAADQLRFAEELLATYNFTLSEFGVPPVSEEWTTRVGWALMRGALARDVVGDLEPSNYQLETRASWACVLEAASTYPTLLYRFLRRGNVAAFADQLSPFGEEETSPVFSHIQAQEAARDALKSLRTSTVRVCVPSIK